MAQKHLRALTIGLALIAGLASCPNPAVDAPADDTASPTLVLTGYVEDGRGLFTAGQWVNGEWRAYQGNSAIALRSFEKDGKVYSVGRSVSVGDMEIPCAWVDGAIAETPTPAGAYEYYIFDAGIVAGDLALAGRVVDGNRKWAPGYWLDGTWNPITLPAEIVANSAYAYSIIERNGTVYIPGYSSGKAFVWSSAGTTILDQPSGQTGARPYRIAIDGTTTFIAGRITQYDDTDNIIYIPCMWLNGVASLLEVPSGYTYVWPTAAYLVDGVSIATAGCQESSSNGLNQIAGYWENGTWKTLPLPAGAVGGRTYSYLPGKDIFCGQVIMQDGTIQPGYWEGAAWHAVSLPPGAVAGYPRDAYVTTARLPTPVKDSSKLAVVTAGSLSGTEAIMATNGHSIVDDELASVATGIAQAGGDTYFSGSARLAANGGSDPAVWKNGVRTILAIPDGGSGYAADIAIQGSTVYACGYYSASGGKARPCLWTNGVRTDLALPPGMANYAEANRLAVVGSDVYVSGYYIETDNPGADSDTWKICYWKNGELHEVASVTGLPGITAFGMEAFGSDAYLCGSSQDASGRLVPAYWKVSGDSPSITTLDSGGASKAGIVDIAFADGSSHAVGTYYDAARGWMPAYWKNGNMSTLETDDSSTSNFQTGIALALDGPDVYAVGMRSSSNFNEIPTLWKNGSIVNIQRGRNYGCLLDVAVMRY